MEVVGGQKTRFKRCIRNAIAVAMLLTVTSVPYSLLETLHELDSTGGVNDHHHEDYILEEREKEGMALSGTAATSANTSSDEYRRQRSIHPLPASRLVDVKRHLNGLVEASVAASNQQVAQYNNGRPKNGKPLPVEEAFPKILKEAGGRVDIMHYHIGTSNNLTCAWEAAEEYYRQIMSDPRRINFVTILREPREHLLSYYYYFIRHRVHGKSIAEFFGDPGAQRKFARLLNNTLAGELGVRDSEDLRRFSSVILPGMKLVFLTDRFDEGLMLLRIFMGWQMIDMTYVALNVNTSGKMTPLLVVIPERQPPTGTAGEGRRPHFDDLPKEVQDSVDELTQLDRAVYEAGKLEFEKTLAPYARLVEADMKEFRRLQAEVQKYLEVTSPSLANDLYRYQDFFHAFPKASPF